MSLFPRPDVKPKRVPKLLVLAYTNNTCNILPLRRLLLRNDILRYIPANCAQFRASIEQTIPCFKYGDVLDSIFLNDTFVGRDENHSDYKCICDDPYWKQYLLQYMPNLFGVGFVG